MAKRKINKIIIHCSDSPDDLLVNSKDINQWHKERGWLSKTSNISIGYHYVVNRKGTVERGRLEEEVGSHCYGHNLNSIGICWIGKSHLTPQQDSSLLKLIRHLINKYGLEPNDVYGHCELNPNKTCPNLNMNGLRVDVLFTKDEYDMEKVIYLL